MHDDFQILLCRNLIDLEKAFILISCDVGEEQSLYEQLGNIPEIKSRLITYGDYDLVAEFQTDTPNQMDEIITNKIRKIEKIRSTITLRVIF